MHNWKRWDYPELSTRRGRGIGGGQQRLLKENKFDFQTLELIKKKYMKK